MQTQQNSSRALAEDTFHVQMRASLKTPQEHDGDEPPERRRDSERDFWEAYVLDGPGRLIGGEARGVTSPDGRRGSRRYPR